MKDDRAESPAQETGDDELTFATGAEDGGTQADSARRRRSMAGLAPTAAQIDSREDGNTANAHAHCYNTR